jgi:hypothetical protein
MNPTIGRIVHYQLSDHDAADINRRRADAEAYRLANPRPDQSGDPGASGHVAHVGNRAAAGDCYPAVVVRTFGGTAANLSVLLDGTDTFWATSRGEGDQPGQWVWPPRVGA